MVEVEQDQKRPVTQHERREDRHWAAPDCSTLYPHLTSFGRTFLRTVYRDLTGEYGGGWWLAAALAREPYPLAATARLEGVHVALASADAALEAGGTGGRGAHPSVPHLGWRSRQSPNGTTSSITDSERWNAP